MSLSPRSARVSHAEEDRKPVSSHRKHFHIGLTMEVAVTVGSLEQKLPSWSSSVLLRGCSFITTNPFHPDRGRLV
ncbi:hypothetical protein NQZ68_009185 [Dissostichus eleginoides]|nr:hypothetical protein NQZ68_009185 [Dissostichus eleginoides]